MKRPEDDLPRELSTTPLSGFDRAPERIGPYRILEKIGEGGMGIAYLAEQEHPIRRRVALKVIRLGMDTKEVVARFEAERQALAMMDHPNIAKVFDAGATEQGRPYFVMEHVPGQPITDYCDRYRLGTKERLGLFIQICQAIHHAHQRAIIHRDIKPSNGVVTVQDEKPVPKVIDFGVAKATGHKLTERTVFTEQGQLVGTPEYMSPEQAEMTGLNVDTRTDIYSLGVLLYRLLTGALPFDPKTLREAGLDSIQRIIREKEPPRPSTRVSRLGEKGTEVAQRRRTSVGSLRKQLHHELDWITMRAIEKDRTRRYQSAWEFGSDVERYLQGDPVVAGPPSTTYRLGKYVRKHKGPVAAVAAVLIAILAFGSLALWQAQKATEEGLRAKANAILASAASAKDPVLKALLIQELNTFPTLTAGQLSKALDVLGASLPVVVLGDHESPSEMPGAITAALSPDGQHVVTASPDGTARVWRTDGAGEPIVLQGHEKALNYVGFSPDGKRIVTCGWDRTVRVWRLDGSERVILRGHEDEVLRAAFSPDGQRVVSVSKDGTARIWSANATGEQIVLRGHTGDVTSGSFSPDGAEIVTASRDGTARVWRIDEPEEALILQGHEKGVVSARYSRDGTRIVTASEDGTARIWSRRELHEPIVLRGHKDALRSASFNPNGTQLVTASADRTARVWRVDGIEESIVLQGHEDGLWWAEFSPDGSRIVTASEDGTARVWEPFVPVPNAFGNVFQAVPTEPYRGRKIRFHAKARAEVQGSGRAQMWVRVDLPVGMGFFDNMADRPITNNEWREYEIVGEVAEDAVNIYVGLMLFGSGRAWMDAAGLEIMGGRVPTSGKLIDGDFEAERLEWIMKGTGYRAEMVEENPAEGRRCVLLERHAERSYRSAVLASHGLGVRVVAFSGTGNAVVTAPNDGTARVWRAEGRGEPLVLRGHEGEVASAAFSPDGQWVVTGSGDGTARVWRADGAGQPVILRGHEGMVFSPAFSPDGQWIVTGSLDETARIWRADGAGEPVVLRGHEGVVWSAAFSPDGQRVVTGSLDETARVWRVDGAGEPVVLRGHVRELYSAAFGPKGQRVVTGSGDGTARVWRADGTGEPVILRGHEGMVFSAAFSPDGQRVVTGSGDGTARVWRADGTGEPIILRGHEGEVASAAFSPDGQRVVTGSWDGTARVWRVTWEGVFDYLRANVALCLTPEERMQYLLESPSEAQEKCADCEKKHGRGVTRDTGKD